MRRARSERDREEERIEQRELAERDEHPKAKRRGQPGAATERGKEREGTTYLGSAVGAPTGTPTSLDAAGGVTAVCASTRACR